MFGWTLCMFRPDLKSTASTVPEIIETVLFGWGLRTPSVGE